MIMTLVMMWEDGTLKGKVYHTGMAEGIGHFAPYYKMDRVIP